MTSRFKIRLHKGRYQITFRDHPGLALYEDTLPAATATAQIWASLTF